MLITILIVIVLLALAIYATQLIPATLDRRLVVLIQLVLVVIAIIYIARVAGIG